MIRSAFLGTSLFLEGCGSQEQQSMFCDSLLNAGPITLKPKP